MASKVHNWYSAFILHDSGNSWKQNAGFKWNIYLPETFLSVAEFQNGSVFCFPRWAGKFYSLQTGVLGNSVKYQSSSDFQLLIAGEAFVFPQAVQWHLVQSDACTEGRHTVGTQGRKQNHFIKVVVYYGSRRHSRTKTATVVAYTFCIYRCVSVSAAAGNKSATRLPLPPPACGGEWKEKGRNWWVVIRAV